MSYVTVPPVSLGLVFLQLRITLDICSSCCLYAAAVEPFPKPPFDGFCVSNRISISAGYGVAVYFHGGYVADDCPCRPFFVS